MKAEGIGRYLPIAAWLPSYNRTWLRLDVVAGLSTAAVVIPKAMAYATIAGLPVQMGLYAALIPMLVYAVFGTARTLSFSTSSTIAILVAAQIKALGPNISAATEIQVATTLAFLVGVALTICALLRLGVVADLISDPVLVGFKAGIGLVIILDQLPKLLGVHIIKAGFFRDIASIETSLPHGSLTALTVGIASLLLIFALEHFAPKIPAPLIAVAVGVLATVFLGLQNHGVPILGKVPAGFPPFALPNFSLVGTLWPASLGIALMSFTESVAAGRAFSPSSQRPDPNGEMFATGVANIAGSFFNSMPAGGGATQTNMNTNAGARSQLAEIVTALVVLATLLFLSPILALIPTPTLAAIIVAATLPMISVPDFRDIIQTHRMEFWWALTAMLGVIWLGTLQGIVAAVILSIVMLLFSANRPPLYQLARKPGTDVFRPLTPEHPDDETFSGLLIVRTDGSLTFASAPKLRDKLGDLLDTMSEPRVILVDLSGVPLIDYTALKMLAQFQEISHKAGTDIWLASLSPSVLETLRRTALDRKIGREHLFFNIPLAVEAFQSRS